MYATRLSQTIYASAVVFVPDIIAERIEGILQDSGNIKEHLNQRMPKVKDLAMSLGRVLQKILQ